MAKRGTKRAAAGAGSLQKVTKLVKGKEYQYWQARISVGTDPGTGKQRQKTFTSKSQADAQAWLNKVKATIDNGTFVDTGKMTLQQWFEIWLTEYMGGVKPLTVKQYQSMSRTHIFPALGAVRLDKLTSPQIQRFYNELGRTGRSIKTRNKKTGKIEISKGPLSPKTVKNVHGILSKALNTAVSQGMLSINPAGRVTVPRVEPKEIQPLTEEQQKAFFEAIRTHKHKNLYTTIILTGLRESEAIGLTWDCVDFQKGTLKVYRQYQKRTMKEGGYQFAALKNDKTRTIKLSPYMLSILEQQEAKQAEEKSKAGDAWKGFQNDKERETYFIFTSEIGLPLSSDTVYGCFKRIAKKIGAPYARVHDLRHTFATVSLQCGDDLKTVQNALGHATAAFTMSVYAHVSERMLEESAARQQEYIKSLGL